jgi:aminopeptidase N
MKPVLALAVPVVVAVTAGAPAALAQTPPGHRLPEGSDRAVRERDVDVQHVAAALTFDMGREEVAGTVAVTFVPLRPGLRELAFDAASLDVSRVEIEGGAAPRYELSGNALRVHLDAPLAEAPATTARITYRVHPRTGLYFFPAGGGKGAQAWNYGEGGLHYGWLPLYNDVNDRFTADFEVTVPAGFRAVANGVLEGTSENADGTRTFHWVQDKPIPNYLLTVDVGEFASVPLPRAAVDGRAVPLSVWTPPGTEEAAAFSFKDTPRMVEFFSRRFGYPYPWAKYDQVVLREFSVGAMETTTATGFADSHLHRAGDPPDSSPAAEQAFPTWTYEDTIAHELAHHWFGDLVTCASLGSIWLNESFATFAHTLWTGEAHGEDDLTYQRWRYLNTYLSYVQSTGTVRPMEYLRWTAPGEMYQEETTYIKGSLVLHMIRHVVGDEAFFRSIAGYLHRHEYGSVQSVDLEEALRQGSGRNLSWFFEDWIRGGGGHPVFQVSYRWVPERKQVDLTVKQTQADQPFENAFRMPVDVEVVTDGGARTHQVEVSGWLTRVSLPAETRPRMVVFDQGGWIVSEVRFDRPLEDVLYQLDHGLLAERLRAARQLATALPRRPESSAALARVLADPSAHWGLRSEAALDLGTIGGEAAATALVAALGDGDDRVRRAVVVALGDVSDPRAAAGLRAAVERDRSEGVAASAALSLGRAHAPGARDVLTRALQHESRWYDIVRIGAVQGLARLEDPTLASTFAGFLDPRYNRQLRIAALDGWFRAAPADPALPGRLRELARDRNLFVRGAAVEKLGLLHRAADATFLRDLAADPDPNLAASARAAAEEIEAFAKP